MGMTLVVVDELCVGAGGHGVRVGVASCGAHGPGFESFDSRLPARPTPCLLTLRLLSTSLHFS